MPKRHRDPSERIERLRERFGDPTQELHAAYDDWLADQASRPDNKLTPFEFDPDSYPEQDIYVPKVLARDPSPRAPDLLYYRKFDQKMARSLGSATYRALVNAYQRPTSADDPTPIAERLKINQQAGRNTIAITSHKKFEEFGYNKAARFRAKRDRPHIQKRGALFNKLMTRQGYDGISLVEHFRPVGHAYFSGPKSDSAEKFGVPAGANQLLNALFTIAIQPDLEAGGFELDAALSGSEIKPVYSDEEKTDFSHLFIPDIDPASIVLLEKFDDVFGATVTEDPMTGEMRIIIDDLLDIQELLKTYNGAEIIDMVYGGIVKAVEEITHKDVVYNRLAPVIGKTATTG